MVQIGPQSTRLGINSQTNTRSGSSSSSTPAITPASLSSGSLSIQESNSPFAAASSSRRATRREQVESRTSNLLLNTSTNLSNRQSIVSGLSSAIAQLTEIAQEIDIETNPNRREDLEAEAQSLANDLQNELAAAAAEDPTIAEDLSVSDLTRPTADSDNGSKFSQNSIRGVPSFSELGLDTLDFSDIETTLTTLETASSAVSLVSNELNVSQGELRNIASELGELAISQSSLSSVLEGDPTELSEKLVSAASGVIEEGSVDSLRVQDLLTEESTQVQTQETQVEESQEEEED